MKMFRVTRLVLLGRNSYKIPLFNKGAVSKQVIVEYSIVSDNKETLPKNETSPLINKGTKQKYVNEEVFPNTLNCSTDKIMAELKAERKKDILSKDLLQKTEGHGCADIIKILKIMAAEQNRSVEILDKLSFMIKAKSWALIVPEISDILYCFARLSYRNKNVLSVLTEQLKSVIETSSPEMGISILHSLSTLRYRDCELLDALLKSVSVYPLDIRVSLKCLLSITFLNYPSSQAKPMFEFLSKLEVTDFCQTTDFISFVWACVTLNQLQYISEKHFTAIFSETFLSKAIRRNFHPGIQIKLLNIKTAAQYMSNENLKKIAKKLPLPLVLPSKTQKSPFFLSVEDTLSYIFRQPGYFKTEIDTGAGFILDAEYNTNSKNEPVPLNKGQNKIGLLLLEYRETCSDNSPTGIFSFKVNILEKQGYKVVILNHAEYPLNSSISDKVDFLVQEISAKTGADIAKARKISG